MHNNSNNHLTPNMRNISTNHYKTSFKLNMPNDLHDDLKRLARERALSLSAMIRLVLTEYVRSKK